MHYPYVTADVFSASVFGGNPLAVITDAQGLSDAQMQAIAREFNYAETAFVLPATLEGAAKRVRIFTPMAEVPFAGHPNVGTAVVLARSGTLGSVRPGTQIVFEELAGPVPITLLGEGEEITGAELTAPTIKPLGSEIAPAEAAVLLSLREEHICFGRHPPVVASAGLAFLMVELSNLTALGSAHVDVGRLAALERAHDFNGVFLYTAEPSEAAPDFRARMFAPSHGIPEDPVTGSANAALGILLASATATETGTLRWTVEQGVEMGRPGRVEITAVRSNWEVTQIRIAGRAVEVCRGGMTL
ncbi:MAG: PhzF family phenazine biosynthesis protein [Rhodospirillales bacterium]|nr:PhzF family phenazine biosynthesis protein [Rhodospirillales bacterium]